MFKFPLFVTIFFGYAYAGLAPMIRQAYAGSGLTDEQIFEDLGKTAIIVEPKPFELNLDFDIEEQPKPFELNLDFDIEEILRSVRKKRSTAEVEVEKSKKTTEKPYRPNMTFIGACFRTTFWNNYTRGSKGGFWEP